MTPCVRDLMQTEVRWIAANARVPDIERLLAEAGISGAPVLDTSGQLCGVLSRGDLVRRLSIAHGEAEQLSDYYRDPGGFGIAFADGQSVDDIAAAAGREVDRLRAADLMSRQVVSIEPDASLAAAASLMVRHGVHRLPVTTTGGALCGVITTLDVTRAVADGLC